MAPNRDYPQAGFATYEDLHPEKPSQMIVSAQKR